MMKPNLLLLLVPLAWSSFGFAQAAPQQSPSAHVWRQLQTTDAAHTYTYTRFTLAAKMTTPHDQVPNRPTLAVDCIPGNGSHPAKGRFLAANLLVGTTLKIVYVEPEEIRGTSYFPKIVVRYRTDDAKDEQEEQWSAGTAKTSASIPKDSLRNILRAHTVSMTVDDDHGSQLIMLFDMPDPTLVEDACSVDEHKE